MGLFDIFKRNRREVNKANQEQGKAGEEQVKAKYEFNGYKVERTGKGHDYRATKRNWFSGKKETKYVEVKTGNSKLSPLQRKKKKQLGSKYVEERVNSNPIIGYGGNSLLGSNQSTKKRKQKDKSSNTGLLDTMFGSDPSSKPKKSHRSNLDVLFGSSSSKKSYSKKNSDNIWSSSKPSKRKKSSRSNSDSIWGSGSSSGNNIWGSSKRKKFKL